MNFLNKAQLIGNVTRDPEMKKTKGGQSVVSVGVATNRRWKDSNTQELRESVEYTNVVFWGRLAEIVETHVQKGSKIFVEGRLQTRSWEDDAGIKHFRTEIIAQDMIVLGKRKAYAGDEESTESSDLPTDLDGTDIPF